MDVPILYEDNHLLLVQKPVNIPVQGYQSGDKDLLTHLKEDIKYLYQKPGNVYLGLVHRLDRPVGGAMVFAKSSKAAPRLQKRRQDYLTRFGGTQWNGPIWRWSMGNRNRLEAALWITCTKTDKRIKCQLFQSTIKKGKRLS